MVLFLINSLIVIDYNFDEFGKFLEKYTEFHFAD